MCFDTSFVVRSFERERELAAVQTNKIPPRSVDRTASIALVPRARHGGARTMAESEGGRRPRRAAAKAALLANQHQSAPSAMHYVGYVEEEETPEMIMQKFAQLEKIQEEAAAASSSVGSLLILAQARADLVREAHACKIATEVEEVGLDAEPLLAALLGRFFLDDEHLSMRTRTSFYVLALSRRLDFWS